MITGIHAMFYSSEAEALRAFIRDKLGFSCTDVGGGWLIFDVPDADLGCHPSDSPDGRPSGTPYLSFTCDDLDATVAELKQRGVDFTDSATDVGYGRAVHFRMPGNFEVELYQPHYTRGGNA